MAIRHLRFSRVWIAVGVLLLVAVTLASVVTLPTHNNFFMLQDKVLHMLVYAFLMGWFAQIFRHDLTRLALVAGFVLMGIGIEFLQGMVPARQFDVLDMIANTSGVVLAWALGYTWVGNILQWVEGLLCRRVLRL